MIGNERFAFRLCSFKVNYVAYFTQSWYLRAVFYCKSSPNYDGLCRHFRRNKGSELEGSFIWLSKKWPHTDCQLSCAISWHHWYCWYIRYGRHRGYHTTEEECIWQQLIWLRSLIARQRVHSKWQLIAQSQRGCISWKTTSSICFLRTLQSSNHLPLSKY